MDGGVYAKLMTCTLSVDQFVLRLKRRQIVGSNQTALETAILLRTIISNARWSTGEQLIGFIKEIAVRLVRAQPVGIPNIHYSLYRWTKGSLEFAVGNIIRRVLHLIREDFKANIAAVTAAAAAAEEPQPHPANVSSTSLESVESHHSSTGRAGISGDSSMFNLLVEDRDSYSDLTKPCYSLRQLVIQSINELIDELETVSSNLASQSFEHIHSNEVVMTIGRSKSVEKFLLEVGKKRKFQVIVAESAPTYNGHEMALSLAKAGIDTSVIADSAIFALMARVNKVIIGCHAVTANGGLIAPSGTLLLASAAQFHSTPICVVTGLYKLTPIYPENHDTFNLIGNPNAILPFSDGHLIEHVDVINPIFDYVPPTLVNLFITNVGGQPPSYIYRLLGELYHICDYKLD